MKITLNILLIVSLLFQAKIVIAQVDKPAQLTLNLAEIDPGEKKTVTGNNSYNLIVLKNAIVGKGYSIKISKKRQLIDPLTVPDVSGVSGGATKKDDPCHALNLAYLDLYNLFDPANDDECIKTEKEVSLRINVLQTEIDKHKCADSALIDRAEVLIKKCQREIRENITVNAGEIVVITVIRDQNIWTWELVGESPGEWVMSYGFGFTSSALESRTYHMKQLNDTSFQIQKDAKYNALDLSYIPAIFYSYLPASKYNSTLNWSLITGLGFDLNAPVVFFGGGFMFRHNIGLNMGVAFQQQNRLKSQYAGNEILKLALEKDQLHDKIYRPNLFISINFRFDKSPFKTKE